MNNPQDIFMLCESIQESQELANLDRTKYKANVKYDGERVMCVKKGQDIVLFNRRGNIISYKFSEVVKALSLIERDFMIDGEVINIDNSLGGNFNLLSRRALTKDKKKIALLEKEIPVKFMAFDILTIDGKTITNEPLSKRLTFLTDLLKDKQTENLQLVPYGEIDEMLKLVEADDGEGIVIKNINGVYESKRSKNCYKHKRFHETTITITGFTDNNAGIRATDNNDTAVQISGSQSDEVRQILQSVGYATINIQYLTQSKEGKFRFPSYRSLVREVKNAE